jgi:hypothetical protein
LAYNALTAGHLGKAAAGFGRLPEPADDAWRPAREKVRRMLARADTGPRHKRPANLPGSAHARAASS